MIKIPKAFNTNFTTTAKSLVHRLENSWEKRSEKTPFYTLGAASYLDATPWSGGTDYYTKKSATNNVLLISNFCSLYSQVFTTLKNLLKTEIGLLHSMPGFHIFGSCKEFLEPVASIHYDRQFQSLKWPGPVDRVFSFTIPVEIPTSGAGLTYWDQVGFSEEVENHIKYETGDMVYHFGQIKHQMTPFKEHKDGDFRITIQGHGVLISGVYYIYW